MTQHGITSRFRVLRLAITMLLAGAAFAQDSIGHIIPMTDSPIEVISYRTFYGPATQVIAHRVTMTNTSDRDVVAVSLRFMTYDAFEQHLVTATGAFVDSFSSGTTSDELPFNHTAPGIDAYDTYGTGIVYVRAVRYADGTVWFSDFAEQYRALLNLNPAFTRDNRP